MNAFMAKQLGLSDKFADLSQKFSPEELYGHLKFTAMTSEKSNTQSPPASGQLPPNQKIAPITPSEKKTDLKIPGKLTSKPVLIEDQFNLSYEIAPRDLINPKKKKE